MANQAEAVQAEHCGPEAGDPVRAWQRLNAFDCPHGLGLIPPEACAEMRSRPDLDRVLGKASAPGKEAKYRPKPCRSCTEYAELCAEVEARRQGAGDRAQEAGGRRGKAGKRPARKTFLQELQERLEAEKDGAAAREKRQPEPRSEDAAGQALATESKGLAAEDGAVEERPTRRCTSCRTKKPRSSFRRNKITGNLLARCDDCERRLGVGPYTKKRR